MPDYKALYFALFRANARASEQLLEAQRQAEEAVCAAQDPATLLFLQEEKKPQPSQTHESAGAQFNLKLP